tara:strand:- start:747 stop:1361 length:615 start_codon:yes stop_codon:yes gene_type:complete
MFNSKLFLALLAPVVAVRMYSGSALAKWNEVNSVFGGQIASNQIEFEDFQQNLYLEKFPSVQYYGGDVDRASWCFMKWLELNSVHNDITIDRWSTTVRYYSGDFAAASYDLIKFKELSTWGNVVTMQQWFDAVSMLKNVDDSNSGQSVNRASSYFIKFLEMRKFAPSLTLPEWQSVVQEFCNRRRGHQIEYKDIDDAEYHYLHL